MDKKVKLEIERRWLLKEVPKNIDLVNGGFKKTEIKQWYISTKPVIRLRSHDDKEFVLCIKTKGNGKGLGVPEIETSLSLEEFKNLSKFVAGKKPVAKTRYYIPIGKKEMSELDIFSMPFNNLIIVEIEFKTKKAANDFIPPSWFGSEEITGLFGYSNSFLYNGSNGLV